MANRRTGLTKGRRNQKGGAHQIPWREDAVILDRIRVGMRPWMEQRSARECLEIVNDHLAANWPKEPLIDIDTIYNDRKRALELQKSSVAEAVGEHVAEYNHAIAQAWQAFHEVKETNPNRGSYISTIGSLVEKKSKLDGSLRPESQTTVVIQHAQIIATVFVSALDDPEWQLTEAQREQGRRILAKHAEGLG